MCEMLNLYLPTPAPVAAPAVRGFEFVPGGEVQKDFRQRFPDGAIWAGHCAGPCLCGFSDWPALWQHTRELVEANRVQTAAVVSFWAGSRYTLRDRTVDLGDEAITVTLTEGEVALLVIQPPARRAHARVVSELTGRVGGPVIVQLKNGITLRGTLGAFDPISECGEVDGTPFVASAVRQVTAG